MSEIEKTLGTLPIGARLIYRAKKDWREAVVSRILENDVTIIVCSPSGHTYRVHRKPDTVLHFDGAIPFLTENTENNWREELVKYDLRW